MANPFDDDCEILEGFLCPICREDLKTPERLTLHVERQHSEEQDLLKSLKDIFSKAKKKIKSNFDETVDLAKSFDSTLKPLNPYAALPKLPQEVGIDCSHYSYFKAVRTPRVERYANETNKLIIRLHKLLDNRPTDPVKRKAYEQEKVPWLDGTSVKLCPSCAKSFHLARRQHHCRLCGSIMCNDCSEFLEIEAAKNLVDPASALARETRESSSSSSQGKERDKDQDTLRVCDHCLRLLENRKEMQDSRTYRPPIVLYYEKLMELQKEIEPDIPMYMKMINSLYEGDNIFTIADASALRAKIGRMAENIDNISKAILGLPYPQGSREEALKKAIRLAFVKYIKEEMLCIPPIPLEAEIRKLQDKRRMDMEQRIERERRLALEAYEKYELVGISPHTTPSKGPYASGSAVTTLDNWSGHQSSPGMMADPLVEQINIIKGYIKQARAALRFEEVATLEINLRELQQEFYQRHQQQSQHQSAIQ